MDFENMGVKGILPLATIIAAVAVKSRLYSTNSFVLIHTFLGFKAASALFSARERLDRSDLKTLEMKMKKMYSIQLMFTVKKRTMVYIPATYNSS